MSDTERVFRIGLLGEVARRSGLMSQGGTGLSLIRLANALTTAGQDVDVVMSASNRLADYSEQPCPSIGIHAVGRGQRGWQFARLLRYWWRRRPGFLIVQDSRAIDLGLYLKILLGRRIRLICTIHNEAVVRIESDAGSEKRKQRRFRRMYRHADAVVGVSPGMIDMACQRVAFPSCRLHVIPNAAFQEAAVQHAWAHPVPRPASHAYHIVSAGRLSPEKDQATMLRGLQLLADAEGMDVHLTILGEGPGRYGLEQLARDLGVVERVHMPGFVRHPLNYMADADAFVLSSLREAFGFVLVEALAMGLPIVSTDCPYGPAFILSHGRFGRLVPVGDERGLADALACALVAQPDRSALTERASEFRPDTIARKYMELLESTLTG